MKAVSKPVVLCLPIHPLRHPWWRKDYNDRFYYRSVGNIWACYVTMRLHMPTGYGVAPISSYVPLRNDVICTRPSFYKITLHYAMTPNVHIAYRYSMLFFILNTISWKNQKPIVNGRRPLVRGACWSKWPRPQKSFPQLRYGHAQMPAISPKKKMLRFPGSQYAHAHAVCSGSFPLRCWVMPKHCLHFVHIIQLQDQSIQKRLIPFWKQNRQLK